jgi:phospholipid/cholesterol/gamma-HCH transport system substrate-binding protein
MQYNKGRRIRLGLFILIGTLVFVIFFYLIGRSSQLFSKTVTLHTVFPSVSGLRSGDHVRFSGIIVGMITGLEITSDTTVVVDMSVERNMLRFIRQDSRVEIRPEAIIGDKMVVIYSGTSESDHVKEGDYLQPMTSVHLEDVVVQLSGELSKADAMIRNLVEVSHKVNSGDGNVGRMLNDSTLMVKLDESASNFAVLTQNLKILSQDLKNPESDIGKLVYRDHLTRRMDTIMDAMDRITENTEVATRELAGTSSELHLTAQEINTGSGTVNKLLYDSIFADSLDILIQNINQTVVELEKVAVNLQHKRLFGGAKPKKEN